jgi:hypothetical protein
VKLCIPIEPRAEGGMFTFVSNFLAYLGRHGIATTRDPDDTYDVLFANSWVVPFETVLAA